MENIILSKNAFITCAFRQIFKECDCKDVCVVDIDSYGSLNELLNNMKKGKLSVNQKVYFLKGNSVLSNMLVSITAFHVLDSLAHIRKVILTGIAPCYVFVGRYINGLRELSVLTHREKQIVYALVNYKDVSSIARAMNANHKTIYSRVRKIAIKLNLRDIGQVRKFIFSEITT
ncbi:helix-turn-helix transcriptional regulator [Kluyvera sp. Awk 3]|uniref:helix-turn-helix transcriptional regulator n=1 Tax=Kluyvera sp. Awk 3 TaxID=2963956 RepID=UPI0023033C22|nr:hypothetical protein [Kluyvera sp. Awk 3]MDA8491790.1 hypothetical protein [Kluyvera sp. Awk 3]